MTDSAEREKKADFVNYFAAGTSIVVQRGNPHGIADLKDLCGQVVAVETATVQVDLLRRAQSRCQARPIAVRTYKTNADALPWMPVTWAGARCSAKAKKSVPALSVER